MSFLDPAVALLHSLLMLVAPAMPGPEPVQLAAAIVVVTVAVRTALLPLSVRSFRGQRARTSLAPEVDALRKKHPHDRATLAREIHELHRRAGVSPLAGFGPLLLTAPVVLTLFRMVNLLGSPLSTHWLPLLSTGSPATAIALVLLLLALLAVAWVSSRQQPEGPVALRLLPFGTVAFAVAAPLAVSVYLLSSTAWTVAERAILPRLA
jgi:YidC/Oxa1 family membrane protein insertase